jgi:hypothetical protein
MWDEIRVIASEVRSIHPSIRRGNWNAIGMQLEC